MLTQKIIEKEFALSGSEQNPDLTGKDLRLTLPNGSGRAPRRRSRRSSGTAPTSWSPRPLPELVDGMNELTGEPLIDAALLRRQIVARDLQIDNPYTKDPQVMAIRNARRFRGDRLARTAAPHKILDPKAGPLIAVRLNILTRKTLGGLQTDLSGRVLSRSCPAARCPACSRPGRWPGSAAAGCTATAPWKGPSSAAACSAGARRAVPWFASPRCDAQRGCGGSSHRGTCCVGGSEPPCGGWLYPPPA